MIVWLRLAETGEVIENQVGQAIVDWIRVEPVVGTVVQKNAGLGGDIFDIGEVIAQLGVVAVRGNAEIAEQVFSVNGVRRGERITLNHPLAAESRENVDDVVGNAVQVEVHTDTLTAAEDAAGDASKLWV